MNSESEHSINPCCHEGYTYWKSAKKLHESKIRVEWLICTNLAVFPVLLGVTLLSLWVEMDYPKRIAFAIWHMDSFSDVYSLLPNINYNLLMSSMILWIIYHSFEFYALFAVSMENARFCRLHLKTIAPILQLLTIFYFVLVMWFVFSPLQKDQMATFIMVTGSTIVFVGIFFNIYLQSLSKYVKCLTLSLFNCIVLSMNCRPNETV